MLKATITCTVTVLFDKPTAGTWQDAALIKLHNAVVDADAIGEIIEPVVDAIEEVEE